MLKVQPTQFESVTLRFARGSFPFDPWSLACCLFQRRVAVVEKMAQHFVTGTQRLAVATRAHKNNFFSTSTETNTTINNETVRTERWLKSTN